MFASKDTLLTRPSGGYTIARSVRLRSSASAYFNRTFTTPTNNTTWTWSAWIKRGALDNVMLWAGASGNLSGIGITSNQIIFYGSAGSGVATSTAVFRDPSAWYHMVFVSNGTTIVAYVNNVQVLSYTGTLTQLNASGGQLLFCYRASSSFFDGYATEVNFIDGQALTPSSFGSTNAITGVWQPIKYTGTYGTNGFYLNFSDNSNNTATTIGKDYSGNGNNWTPNNISVTAGSTYDSMTDVPTLTSATAANYAVMNPLSIMGSGNSLTNGNLTFAGNGSSNIITTGTFGMSSGKWYVEATITNGSGGVGFGIAKDTEPRGSATVGNTAGSWGYNGSNGVIANNGSTLSTGATYTTSDVISFALDMDAGTLVFYKNNASQGSTVTGLSGTFLVAVSGYLSTVNLNFGQRPFSYTPPTGFVALNTYNLPASTITNGAAYMAATTYTGNGGTQAVANTVGSTSFQPDFVWIKSRSAAYYNTLYDSVRGSGATKSIYSNSTDAEGAYSVLTNLSSFNSNGFTVGTTSSSPNTLNESGATFVGWQWKAGGTSASNINGSITSTVSANTTAGFSVVTYTGNGSSPSTVGHGLGVAPSMMIFKARSVAGNSWDVYHASLGATKYLLLDTTGAAGTSTWLTNTAPTSSIFTLSNFSDTNSSGVTYVAYCFAAVAGYSAFGSYTGNGSADGPFCYTGFRPRWIMLKNSSAVTNWVLWDTSRNPYNLSIQQLFPNTSDAEDNTGSCDILSNGFKLRNTNSTWNGSGNTIVYACFAENPFRNALAR